MEDHRINFGVGLVASAFPKVIDEDHCGEVNDCFCLSSSAKRAEVTAGAVVVAGDTCLSRVYTDAFLTKTRSAYIASISCIKFVSRANLKATRKPIVKIETLWSNKFSFICSLTLSNMLVM